MADDLEIQLYQEFFVEPHFKFFQCDYPEIQDSIILELTRIYLNLGQVIKAKTTDKFKEKLIKGLIKHKSKVFIEVNALLTSYISVLSQIEYYE